MAQYLICEPHSVPATHKWNLECIMGVAEPPPPAKGMPDNDMDADIESSPDNPLLAPSGAVR